MTTNESYEQIEALREKGFKATSQRLVIANMVQMSKEHLSSEEIFERVKNRLPGISRATVYNTLHMLTNCEMIQELDLNSGRVIYDGNPAPHHHMVCDNTGKILDIPNEMIKNIDLTELEKKYDISSYTIVFHGTPKTIINSNESKGEMQ